MNLRTYIWSAVGVVVLAYVLMALVQKLIPALIIIAVLVSVYQFMFKRRP